MHIARALPAAAARSAAAAPGVIAALLLVTSAPGTAAQTWSRVYAAPGLETRWSAVPLANGDVAVWGDTEIFSVPSRGQLVLARVDVNGDIVWQDRVVPGPAALHYLRSRIVPAADGGIFAVGAGLGVPTAEHRSWIRRA